MPSLTGLRSTANNGSSLSPPGWCPQRIHHIAGDLAEDNKSTRSDRLQPRTLPSAIAGEIPVEVRGRPELSR